MLTLYRVGNHLRLALDQYGRQTMDATLLAPLWEPRCLGWHSAQMVWQGYQRGLGQADEHAPAYLQEWRVVLIGERPPAGEVASVFDTYNQR